MDITEEGSSTPNVVGRGRGLLCSPLRLRYDTPVSGRGFVRGDSQGIPGPQSSEGVVVPPPSPVSHTSQNNSSPSPNPDTIATEIVSQMGDVIQLVGQRVAQSILTQLSPSASTPLPAPTATPFHAVSSTSAVDAAPVQFVSHRKLKDPPCFRGDGSDLISVREWEDLMRAFIKLGSLRPEEQAEEILVHLRGKAKDVVQVGIRNSVVDVTRDPEAIFGILRRHFDSAQCSPLPLADFYTTLPEKGESAFDYWLRLHRAVDLAVERLKERGQALGSPSTEVTRMFIKNCPSPELAMIFRSKTIDKWTANEVQEILCESHSGGTLNSSSTTAERVAVNAQQISTALPVQPTEKHIQPQSTDSAALERLIGMLEKVLLQRSFQPGLTTRPNSRRSRIEGLHDKPCSVCHDMSHTAFMHCRDHKLCFLCHSNDHTRRACPGSSSSSAPRRSEN